MVTISKKAEIPVRGVSVNCGIENDKFTIKVKDVNELFYFLYYFPVFYLLEDIYLDTFHGSVLMVI